MEKYIKTIMEIVGAFNTACDDINVEVECISSPESYSPNTLFCPAGMQKFIDKFKDKSYVGTHATIQRCIRLNDIDEIGDGTHLIAFDMIGLFCFRTLTVPDAIKFFMTFLERLGLKVTYVTIHPDKSEWKNYYDIGVDVREDSTNIWEAEELSGYCTEFYIDDVEIGNIVNLNDDCIDVGFGLQRLLKLLTPDTQFDNKVAVILSALYSLNSVCSPSNTGQGYVYRKLLRKLYLEVKDKPLLLKQFSDEVEYFKDEVIRQTNIVNRYNLLKDKHSDKSPEWWLETHGVDLSLI